MRYLSVCSGVEAATVAWHHMGWEPVAFSEIEKFPSAVLAHHYPSVPNWGDMTKFQEWPDANVDVLVGGTPCQSFSVAGLRKGLDDPRGNLMLTFGAIAQRYRPQWLVWENVPGVLSSNGGRDFGTFLGMLGELGYGFAYRVLDAQYFGVPQRRRRVFVCAVRDTRNWQRAAAVLFERHSLSGHPAPSRQARKGTAGGIALGVDNGRWWDGGDVAATITTKSDDQRMPDKANAQLVLEPVVIQGTLIGRSENAGSQGSGADVSGAMFTLTKTDVHAVAQPVAFYDYLGSQNGGVEIGISPTLKKKDGVAITQPVAVDFRHTDLTGDTAHTIQAKKTGGFSLNYMPGVMQPVAMVNMQGSKSNAVAQEDGPSYTLNAMHGHDVHAVATAMQVRRLTPVECSRLQGFPDTYLELTYGTESEAHASQVLHELWRQTGTIAREGWRPGIIASLLTPEVLLAGVYGGWVSWKVAASCACSSGEISGKVNYAEGFVRRLQEAGQDGRSPYQRESFRQLAGELGCSLSQLPLEEAQAREILFCSELWSKAQRTWPLRYALATETQRRSGKLNADGPRYKALGNSMAVPVMSWIGERINQVEQL